MPTKTPNLFIVGAFKCGTTAMASYLADHRQAFMSTPKEPGYFATDFPAARKMTAVGDYLKLFRSVAPYHHVVGEASVSYLYSREALRHVHDFNPQAKIMVMLRNPVDLVYSFHSQNLFSLNEQEQDFARAWRLQDARAAGRHVPRQCRIPQFLQYRRIGKLGEQTERLLDIFPREQVHFVFFEDFARDTQNAYRAALRFLELPDDHRETFPRINSNKRHRNRWLSAYWIRKPRWMQSAANRIKVGLGGRGRVIERCVRWLFTTQATRPPLPAELRSELNEAFRDDVQKLSSLTGTDLCHWTGNRRAAA